MELEQVLAALSPRSPRQIADAAHVTQANLVSLRTAWGRVSGSNELTADIRTPSPGPVVRAREFLIDRNVIKSYGPDEILLRLHQIWGEFCALCWLFPHVDPQAPISFDPLPDGQTTRCPGDAIRKLDEVQRHFWRIRHEQQLRFDAAARHNPAFLRDHEVALSIPLRLYGCDIQACPDATLMAAACEYAGMLAALRWATDDRWDWEGPGIMDLTLTSLDASSSPPSSCCG